MPIVFPRDMPLTTEALSSNGLDPQLIDFTSGTAGGKITAIQAGQTLWAGRWTLGEMELEVSDEWHAWITSLRGSKKLFRARDHERPYPKAYRGGFGGLNRAGGGAFPADGMATGWAVNADGDVLTLNGLPAGFKMGRGDFVGFRWARDGNPAQGLTMVRSVESVEASGAGQAIFSIEPPLPALVPGGAEAYLQRPACYMRLVQDETRVPDKDWRGTIKGAVISAVQDFPSS